LRSMTRFSQHVRLMTIKLSVLVFDNLPVHTKELLVEVSFSNYLHHLAAQPFLSSTHEVRLKFFISSERLYPKSLAPVPWSR
jgi:hypothetical protein